MESEIKQAAAIAAVMQYLKAEEEMMAMQAMAAFAVGYPPAAHATPPQKAWGISGRQAQMQMRGMMQMKTFK